MGSTELGKNRDVTGGVRTEEKVLADDNGLCHEPIDEHRLDELLGGLCGHRPIKREDLDCVSTR